MIERDVVEFLSRLSNLDRSDIRWNDLLGITNERHHHNVIAARQSLYNTPQRFLEMREFL